MNMDYQQHLGKLEETIQSGVTLVSFQCPSFAPCREQKTIIETLAKRFQGAANVMDINIEDHRQFAVRFGITSIPTLIIFKGGVERRRFFGLQSAKVLSRAIKAVLG